MVAAADLQHHLDAGFANVQIDTFTDMFHLDQVCPVLGEQREEPGQAAGPIADSRKDDESTTAERLVPAHKSGQEPEISVSTREHHAR